MRRKVNLQGVVNGVRVIDFPAENIECGNADEETQLQAPS